MSNEWECHLKQVREKLEYLPLANICLIDEIVCDSDSLLKFLKQRWEDLTPSLKMESFLDATPKSMEEEKTMIFEEMDTFEAKLNILLDMMDVHNKRRDIGGYIFTQHFGKAVRKLLLSMRNSKKP
ncbi:hypothetical protein ACH5RR_018119 [Cinchona calisaya]|uniref:Uncharacterized protein n=1 Tax=Cinchona calisaya TaxID=153742 RepID=A0ABD2ZNP9_9GENT